MLSILQYFPGACWSTALHRYIFIISTVLSRLIWFIYHSLQLCFSDSLVLRWLLVFYMMTSLNGNNLRVTGPLCGEFTGQRWIPLTKASEARALMFSFIYAWTNGWVNKWEAGDWRRHRAHYDVTLLYNISKDTLENMDKIGRDKTVIKLTKSRRSTLLIYSIPQ